MAEITHILHNFLSRAFLFNGLHWHVFIRHSTTRLGPPARERAHRRHHLIFREYLIQPAPKHLNREGDPTRRRSFLLILSWGKDAFNCQTALGGKWIRVSRCGKEPEQSYLIGCCNHDDLGICRILLPGLNNKKIHQIDFIDVWQGGRRKGLRNVE